MMWVDGGRSEWSGGKVNGNLAVDDRGATSGNGGFQGGRDHEGDRRQEEANRSGLLTDQELARRIRQQMGEDDDDDDEGGIHL